MPAAGETELVAVTGRGPELAAAARRCWDAGRAILPLDPTLPRAARDALLARLRPTIVDGARPTGGQPVAADTAAVVVTSGTAGAPKGVELTRAGMDAMARGYTAGLGAGPGDRWLACLPLHHVASLAVVARAYVVGLECVAHDSFDPVRVGASPRAEGTTIVSLVPTALRRLLDAGAPLHEFRRVVVGGSPCPPDLRARAERAGAAVVDAYGLSETWGGFALDGVPIAGAEVRVDAPPGANEAGGEILVRGAMVMRGYRLDPRPMAAVLGPDGWLHTGDTGRLRADGRVEVVDRLTDVIISGGVNVSPTEVEMVLGAHPGVDDVCVVGLPDDEWGERVVACVVADAAHGPPALDDLRDFARTRLAVAKLPREVRLVDAIPRTASGKPRRRALRRAQLLDEP